VAEYNAAVNLVAAIKAENGADLRLNNKHILIDWLVLTARPHMLHVVIKDKSVDDQTNEKV